MSNVLCKSRAQIHPRLRGVELTVAKPRPKAQLSAIARSIEVAHREENTKVAARIEDLHDALVGSSRTGVWVLFSPPLSKTKAARC